MKRFCLLRQVVVLLVAVVGLLTQPARASAEDRPFFLRGTAHFVSDTGFVGEGYATHLGHYTEEGHAIISGDNPFALQVTGCAILTAANGDEPCVVITAQLTFFTGTITATDTYWGGKGRFVDAIGSSSLVAQFQPDGTIAIAVEGTIDY